MTFMVRYLVTAVLLDVLVWTLVYRRTRPRDDRATPAIIEANIAVIAVNVVLIGINVILILFFSRA